MSRAAAVSRVIARFSPVLAMLLAVAAGPIALSDAQPAPQAPISFKVEPGEDIDLGSLKFEETAALDVRITNTGDKPIRFERAMGSCSCIKGTVSPDPVMPGEAAIVKLTMQAIIHEGLQRKELYVFAEGQQRPIALKVRATVVGEAGPAITIEPAMLELGHMLPDTSFERTIMLRNDSDEPVQFARVISSCSCVQAQLLDDLTAPGESARLRVTATSKDIGPFSQKLTVWYMGARKPIEIPITGEVSLAVRMNPIYINLATPEQGMTDIPRHGSITVEALDGRAFRILSAGGASPVLAPGDDNSPATRHVVHWDFRDTADDALEPWWIIETDHPEAPILDVRVLAMSLIQKMIASQGPWTLNPDRVVGGEITSEQAFERTVRMIRARAGAVEEVRIDSPLLRAEIVDQKKTTNGLEGTLRITPAPGAAAGMIRATLTVRVDGVEQSSPVYIRIAR